MITIVLYDSQFGCTEKVAQVIAQSIPSARLLRVCEAKLHDLQGVTQLIVGCPTQGGRPTEALQHFIAEIPDDGLKNVKVAAFDTRFREKDQNLFLRLLMKMIGYAAPKIANSLVNRGGNLFVSPEGFIVTGKEGPLASGELERAKQWLV